MTGEVHGYAAFYASPAGAVAARLLAQRLRALWPSLRGQAVLGIGYTAPYLALWSVEASRSIALSPAPLAGDAALGIGAPLVGEDATMPFPDLFFDRVLLVHGLEITENARRLLREVWRVLKDDGRLLVVAPNRSGWWAYSETTPFGHGQPYSPGQIGRLLGAMLFRVERRDTALYMPPSNLRVVLRGAGLWERAGRAMLPRLAGVTITEARKDIYAAVPTRARARRMVLVEAA